MTKAVSHNVMQVFAHLCHQTAPNPVYSTRSAHTVAQIRATTPSFRVNVSDLAASLSFSCVFQFLF